MDRSRDGRRAGAAGGPAYAPRRPRTGFKEASAGDDADDMMDDGHSSRLRERLKKESSGLLLGQSAASISRNKRKRQGSQEMQVQARNGPGDDLEEVTEDTEMGVSEDDDDNPPPLPRRHGKLRPQGKIPEDSMSVDLPAVPRKARTAILKRPQESVLPLSADPLLLQPSTINPSAPAPSSTPSSSSIASLKPGRRTKPSGTKPRGPKLPKVSTPVMVSEQEVEVAEALFDLARLFTQPTSSTMELKLEEKSSPLDSKPAVDSKAFEPAASTTLIIQPSNGPFNAISTSLLAPTPSSALAGPITVFSPAHASTVSPTHHPSPPPGAPAAEAPKRKRPRFRTRPEEGTSNQPRAAAIPATDLSNAAGTSGSQSKEAEYILIRPSITDKCAMKEEANSATPVIAAISSVANATLTFTMPSPANATTAVLPVLHSTVSTGSVPQPSVCLEKKSSNTEKKNVITITKADIANSTFVENKSTVPSVVEKRPKAANLPGPALLGSEEEAPCCMTTPAELITTNLESPGPADAVNGDRTVRPQIDLMVSPMKLPAISNNDRIVDEPEAAEQNLPEKENVEMAIASTGESLWLDGRVEREENELLDSDKEKDREWERGLEQHERGREGDEQNEVDTRKELSKHLPNEHETEKERQRYDSRSSKILRADVGRSQKAVSATSPSGNPSTTGSATGVASNVAALPLSMGLLGWPGGLPGGLSYFPAAAAAAAVAEENPPSVQLPYIMPPRQAWKRCALHVYIARFIDMQQQLSSHHTFFPSTNHLYGAKPYNLNMPLSPAESILGSAVGVPPVGSIAGPSSISSSTAVVSLEVGDYGLNAAAIAAASGIHGVKERTYKLDVMNQKLPAQQQQSVQQQSTVPGHVLVVGFPGTNTGTASVTGAVPTSVTCVSNTNMPSGAAVAVANTGSGSSSPIVGGPSSVVGVPSAVTNGSTATAAVQAQYMHAMMQQSQKFSFAQYPPPFCSTTFNGPPPHVGAQQAAAQFFSGSPFFTTHMVQHSQQQSSHQIVSGGSAPAVKQQQGARPQSPRHSQHQLSSHLQRSLDKDGPVVDNGSTVDSKFPILHRSLYGQTSPNAAVANANPPTTAVLSGAAQSMSSNSPDYNMVGVLAKPPKQRDQQTHQSTGQQQQLHSQPPALPSQLQQQHQSSQMSVKGHESQTTQSFSMSMAGAMSRGTAVGPGPIGLAPVAAVMAPQGHAMIQSMGEAGNFHPSQTGHPQLGACSPHSNLLQQHHQQMQQQHLRQMHQAHQHQTHPLQQQLQQHQNQLSMQSQNQQRAPQVGRGASSGPEDSRAIVDVNISTTSNRGRERETLDDKKLNAKRSIVTTPPLSRELEGCTSMQSSLGASGCITSSRNVGTTLNLMAPTHPNMASRSSVPLIQQQVVQTTKQTVARSRGANSPSPAGTNQSALSSFSDRVSLAGASQPGKVSSPGLLSGQQNATTSSQVSRQAQVLQTAQSKLNQRTSLGQLAVPTAPTAPGTSLQVVLAAAMAKSPQLQQQQQQRAQQAANSCSSSRLSAPHPSPPPSSPGPLPPLPPVSKSAGLNPPKTGSSQKGSFPVSQKSAVTAGKRSSSPSSLPHVSSVLGPSPLAQNVPTQNLLGKNSQQQQMQNQQPTPQQQVQALPQNSIQGQQQQRYQHSQQQGHYHKQSLPLLQQQQQQQSQQHTQQIMRQHLQQQQQLHMFQQHQSPASQSPQAALSQPQPSQQLVSPQQQPPAPQLPQHSTHQQHQLQHLQPQPQPQQQQQPQPQPQLQPQQQPHSPFSGPPANGLSLGSSLSFGAGNNSGAASSIRNNNSDSGGVSQNRPAHSSKQLVNASIPLSCNSGTQRLNSTGPAFLQQFGSSTSPSAQQQSGNPHNSNPSPYVQAGLNSAGGARSTDTKALPDGAEQLNVMRTMQGSSSPTLLSPSQRTHIGGLPSIKPATGHFAGNNHTDTNQPRSGMVLSPCKNSATLSNSSPNGQQSSNTNVHIGADSRTTFVSGAPVSLNQGSLNPSQMHPTSSLSMASAAVPPTGLSPLSTQQPSTSAVQP